MKNFLSLAIVLAVVCSVNAQDQRDELMLGVKVGTNFSNVYDESGQDFVASPKFGIAGGGFLSIPFGKLIGIQPELLFSQKGFRSDGILLGSNYSLVRTTSFIDVPVFFALKPSKFLTLLAGPQFSYLVKQKDVTTYGSNSVLQEKEFENENVRKNILSFAGGVDITMDKTVIGARVAWDVQNNKGDGTSSTPRYKNIWYQFTIGYRFY